MKSKVAWPGSFKIFSNWQPSRQLVCMLMLLAMSMSDASHAQVNERPEQAERAQRGQRSEQDERSERDEWGERDERGEAGARAEQEGNSRVKRLEAELQNAIRQNNQAEVNEIRELLRRLGRDTGSRRDELPSGAPAKPLQPPFQINCGGGGQWEEDEGGERKERANRGGGNAAGRLPDQQYNPRTGFGFADGESRQNWFSAIWGASPGDVFRSARVNPGSYRFKLPGGEYIVALGFCETGEHTPGRRVFDVHVQESLVAESLDPFAVAGNAQAFRLTYAAKVRGDEGLTIDFESVSGAPPMVNAIWVFPKKSEALTPPNNFRGVGSYGMNALFWDLPPLTSVAGYLIERRAVGETSFTPLFQEPVPVSRWLDDSATAGTAYQYRIRSVDVDGRQSDYSPLLSLVPKTMASSTLPVYSIEVAADALTHMLSNVNEDRVADAVFQFAGTKYPVQIRLRGASTRHAAKKSYRIEFTDARPEGRPKVIYLKAEPQDPTLQQEKLTCDLFAAMGLPVSQAEFVNFQLNGRYEGVYLDIEPIRSPFKKRAGLDPQGTLIRASTFQHFDERAPGELSGSDGSLDELREFIRQVNRTDRGELESFVRGATDWDRTRNYLIASMLAHRSEIEATDYFYYRDPQSQRWSFIPWDHNNGNFGMQGPGAGPEEPFIPLFGQTLQTTGPSRDYWYALPTRIFDNDSLRKEYLDGLSAAVREQFNSGRVDQMIDHNYQLLKSEAVLDPYRWRPGHDVPFLASPAKLKSFVASHGRRLLEMIAEEQRRPRPALVINEFQFTSDGVWVELYNRSQQRVSLAVYALGDIEKPRQRPHRFTQGETIEAGEFKVVTIARPDGEGLFNPQGGSIAVLASPSGRTRGAGRDDDDDERAEEDERGGSQVIDFYFYGRQNSRYSYGRSGASFGFMTPTPGKANSAETLLPPALLIDGGVQWKNRQQPTVTAFLTELCPGDPAQSVVLNYRQGGKWQAVAMTVSGGTATATLPVGADVTELEYFFVAKAANGLDRYAPLSAPIDIYHSQVSSN